MIEVSEVMLEETFEGTRLHHTDDRFMGDLSEMKLFANHHFMIFVKYERFYSAVTFVVMSLIFAQCSDQTNKLIKTICFWFGCFWFFMNKSYSNTVEGTSGP